MNQANAVFAGISGSGLTVTQAVNQTGDEITISGQLSDVNNALKNVTYTPASILDTLILTVTDLSGDTEFRTLTLNTSNPASPSTTSVSSNGSSGEIVNANVIDITGNTTLNSDQLFNNGTLTVETNDLLKLDGTRIGGGTIADNGKVEIAGPSASLTPI